MWLTLGSIIQASFKNFSLQVSKLKIEDLPYKELLGKICFETLQLDLILSFNSTLKIAILKIKQCLIYQKFQAIF